MNRSTRLWQHQIDLHFSCKIHWAHGRKCKSLELSIRCLSLLSPCFFLACTSNESYCKKPFVDRTTSSKKKKSLSTNEIIYERKQIKLNMEWITLCLHHKPFGEIYKISTESDFWCLIKNLPRNSIINTLSVKCRLTNYNNEKAQLNTNINAEKNCWVLELSNITIANNF